MDGVIVLEVTQNLRSCSFEDEVIVRAFPNSQKFGCKVFSMQEDASQKNCLR